MPGRGHFRNLKMPGYFFTVFLLLTLVAGEIGAADIMDLIRTGQIDAARREIARSETAVRRDGDLLYYQALIESEGAQSYQFHEAAGRAELAPEFREDNIYRMALYAQATGDYEKLAGIAEDYLHRWERGKYRPQILRLAAMAHRNLKQTEKADLYHRRVMRENEGLKYENLGLIDEAFRLYLDKEYIGAQRICRQLRRCGDDDIVVPALYMLSRYALEQKRTDDAILYYNLLKEGYPEAIGLDKLVEEFGQVKKSTEDSRAEEITGTVYSVQVGVFSIRDNARTMARRMEAHGEDVEISEKYISDKMYYVVFVGRFTSADKAMAFKIKLEQTENEVFHVVAR
jgi:tetratricopeptide (TPR) repeat protein